MLLSGLTACVAGKVIVTFRNVTSGDYCERVGRLGIKARWLIIADATYV